MRIKGWGLLATLGMLAACAMPSVAPTHTATGPGEPGVEPLKEGFPFDLQAYPDGNPFRVLAVDELPIVTATADSEASALGVNRAVDGDLSTQWLNGPYRAPTAWLAVELAQSAAIAGVRIKTGTSPAGTRYDVQVSEDGSAWTTALSNQTNTGWSLETKALPAGTQGKYVRIFWRNAETNPTAHFAVYELAVDGVAGPAPSPTATPTAAPSAPASPSPVPSPSPSPVGTLSRVMPTAVAATSSYSGLVPGRAIDGDVATQWSSGGYKAPEESLTLSFGARQTFGRIRIKTGALPEGVTFKVDVSDDGVTWNPASGRLTNRTWGLENQDVYGAGTFLKVRFFNSLSAPIARFSVFEVEAYATGGPAPTPTPTPSAAPSADPSASPTPTPSAPTGASAWYPDWIGIATQSYYIERVSGRTKLRFSTGIANIGAGHVQVRINPTTKVATQEILDGADRVVERKDASQVVYFEAHGHNHVEGVARYDFRQGSLTGPVLRTSVKTSFCVEDSYKYRSTAEAARYPDCLPEIMGITRNYADLYTANLPGQDFDVTGLPAGEYYVVVLIDPEQVFLDASRSNNTAWTRFYIDPTAGTAQKLASYP